YYLMKHPIYIGFAMILLGYFIYTDSSPGFWLIAPLTILGMIALVLGYEVIDIKSRFPDQRVRVLIDIPYSRDSRIRFEHRIGSLILVLGSLLLVNFLTGHVREYVDTIVIDEVGFKSLWPELDWVWLGVAFIVFTVLFIKTFNGLRNWTIKAIIAIGLITFLRLIWPEVTTLSLIESPYTYLTAPLSVMIISLTTLWNNANWKRALCLGFFLISVYSQLQQTHSITIYLAIGLMVYLLSEFYLPIWAFLRRLSQRIANSWKEWTFGNIRIINHGFYVGFGALAGILLAGSLVGGDQVWGVLIFSIVVIVFSAIWAQLIEGSEKLKRPYGYYGALVGIIFASGLVWLLEYDVWLLIASISVCMPWVQAIGRLRCLINGCCHGSPTDNEDLGIRYFHFRSRVCGLSELKGELLHPTQLYAIIWLFLVGLLMLKFWNDQFVPSFIFGMYLILTGLGRFVEEAYRGEVQTKIIRGLRLYQWTAILSVIIGIVMTCIPQRFDYVIYDLSLDIVWAALIGGFFTFFAMGVDFPNSNKRFSRLV
ncbi:MAG: prolipoprotein diacylglyceryl transferase, partial [Bacteroidia bacterium]|nr:prolipoprotein diacylglyceryl transferase [Bacteroidia bacterium]